MFLTSSNMHQRKNPNALGLAFIVIALFVAPAVWAQETTEIIHDNRNPDELNQSLDSHGSQVHSRDIQKDSVVVRPIAVRPKAEAPKTKTEDEPLSFNFLYYIIQKIKGSDVVD